MNKTKTIFPQVSNYVSHFFSTVWHFARSDQFHIFVGFYFFLRMDRTYRSEMSRMKAQCDTSAFHNHWHDQAKLGGEKEKEVGKKVRRKELIRKENGDKVKSKERKEEKMKERKKENLKRNGANVWRKFWNRWRKRKNKTD